MSDRLLVVVLTTFGGIGCGGAGSLVLVHLRDLIHGEGRATAIALACARLGFVLTIGLITYLVATTQAVGPHTWRLWVFVVGVVLAGGGYAFLGVRALLSRRKGERHG